MRAFGDALDPLRNLEGVGRQVAGDEIDFLLESQSFHQLGVVVVVVVHHRHHLALLEAFDLNAVAVKGREALGADHRVQTAGPRPLEGRVEERPGDLQSLIGVKAIEVRFPGLVILIEGPVVRSTDPADDFPIPNGDEKVGSGVLKERVLLAIERQVGIDETGRHELRAILVEIVVELDKSLDLATCRWYPPSRC